MKPIFTILLAFLVCVSLAACTTPKENSGKEPATTETISPASVINTRTGTVITLGMSREEVEALLDKGTELDFDDYFQEALRKGDAWEIEDDSQAEPRTDIAYGGGKDLLVAYYEEGEIQALYNNLAWSGQESGPTNWSLVHGITYGSSLDEVLEKYGSTGHEDASDTNTPMEDGWARLTYQFDASGDKITEMGKTASIVEIGINDYVVESWSLVAF